MIVNNEWLCECCGLNNGMPVKWGADGKSKLIFYYPWNHKLESKLRAYADKPNRDRYCPVCRETTSYSKNRRTGMSIKHTYHKRPCNPNVPLLKLMSKALK